MDKTEQSTQVWPYQVNLLAAVIRWSLAFFGLGFLINILWLWWDPLWRILVQNGAVVLVFLSSWVSLRLIRRGRAQWAARLFITTGFGLAGLLLLTLGEPFILYSLILLSMITLIGMFILPLPEALKWGGGSLLLYIAALTVRYGWLGYNRAEPELAGLYLFGGLLLGAYLLLGRNIAEQLNDALSEGEAARQELTRRAVQLEQSAAALQASEQKYRAYVDNAPDGIFVVNRAGRYLEVNAAATRLTGYNPAQLLEMSITDLLSPEDRAAGLDHFTRLQSEGCASGEFAIITQTGERRFVLFEAVKLDEDCFLGFHKDITERRRIEDALRQESSFRQRVIENAAEGLSVCHATDDFPYVAFTVWNERMTDLTGYTLAEINQLGWYQSVYSEPSLRQKASERMGRMRHGDNLVNEEWEITCKNGQRRLLAISTALLVTADGSGHVLALMRDLTAQRRLEKQLRDAKTYLEHILATSPITIYAINIPFNRLTFISDNVIAQLGYEPHQFLGDDTFWLSRLHPADRADCQAGAARLLMQGQNSMEYRFQHQAGHYVWMHDAAQVACDETGQPQGIVGVWSDITERVQAAEVQRRYARRLEILHEIDQAILSNQPPVAITQTALRHSSCLIPYQSGVVILFDNEVDEGVIFTSFASQEDAPVLPAGARLPLATFKGLHDYSQHAFPHQPYIIDDMFTIPGATQLADTLQRHEIRAVLVAHLRVNEQMIGVVVFGAAADVFTPCHLEIAQEVAHSLAVAIEHDRLQQARQQQKAQLERSLSEKEALLKEIHHRVKNNLQIISSLLNLQRDSAADAQILDVIQDSQTRIRSMALIHEKLYQTEDLARIDLAEYIHSLTTYLFRLYRVNPGQITPIIRASNIFLEINTAVPCGLILNELISNSLKHAFPANRAGKIEIELQVEVGQRLRLTVRDDGVGFPPDVDFYQSPSLGLQLVQALAGQLEGEVALNRANGAEITMIVAY